MSARDPWFDNAKMALVTLVVVGHAWTLLPPSALGDHAYDWLYAWHVPAFVFVTGYLSQRFDWSRRRMWQLVRTVVVPYVMFEAAIALFRVYVGGERLEDLFTDPHWPMWYLAALFFWRLLTPIFRPMPGAFVVAVAISLVAGVFAGDTLDMARVLGLLPFFVLGLKATPERLELLRGRGVAALAVAFFVGLSFLAPWTDTLAETEWLYYRSRYVELGTTDLDAVLIRGSLLLIGTLGAFAFFALVPRVNGWFTRMGAYTLVVYLFHGFAVKGAEYAGAESWLAPAPVAAVFLVTALAVALALLLAWRPIASVLTELVDPFGYAERHAQHAVDLTRQAAVHEATVEVLEERIEAAVEVAEDVVSDPAVGDTDPAGR